MECNISAVVPRNFCVTPFVASDSSATENLKENDCKAQDELLARLVLLFSRLVFCVVLNYWLVFHIYELKV